MTEKVLCVPTELFYQCGRFQGMKAMEPLHEAYYPLFLAENQEFRPRDAVEYDPAYKQLIPYITVWRHGQLLNYFRGKRQGEARLRGKRSLGIGGHINPCDLSEDVLGSVGQAEPFLDKKYVNGMLRELSEELKFTRRVEEWDIRIVGLVNDDSTTVGCVHLGVVHELRLEPALHVTAYEDDILDLDWRTPQALLKQPFFDQFESWSQMVLRSRWAS